MHNDWSHRWNMEARERKWHRDYGWNGRRVNAVHSPHSAICHTQYEYSWEDCPFLIIHWPYIALIAFLEPSTLFQAAMDTLWMFCLLVTQEGSDSLDVRDFTDFHTTRHCCSLLQYYCHIIYIFVLWMSVILVDVNVVSYWEKIVFKGTSNKGLVIRNDTINIKEGFNSSVTSLCVSKFAIFHVILILLVEFVIWLS